MSSTSKRSDQIPSLSGNHRLAEYIRSGGDGQAVVLCGPEGSGRHTAAVNLAAVAVCTSVQKPCGRCAACRKVALREHPDVRWIAIPEDKTGIPVSLIREVRAEAYIRPGEAENKVYIIESAETLNDHAQNALLKILEEPPAHARFVLITEQEDALLPTVRSRCRTFRMEPLTAEEGERVLATLRPASGPAERAAALAAAEGYIGPALRRLVNDRRREQAAALDLARGMADRSELDMCAAALLPDKTTREQYADMLGVLTEIIAAAIELKCGRELPAPAEEAERMASGMSLGLLMRLRDTVEAARSDAFFNIRPQTAAVALCAALAEELSL